MKLPSAVAPLLSVEGLSVYYDQFRAVHDVTISVDAGEIVSIIGANGAGKSSLLKAIIGQVDRCDGKIMFGGTKINDKATSAIIRDGIVLVPEGRRLFPSLTVEENLLLGWKVGRRNGYTLDEVYELFPLVKGKRRQQARQLSGGQQQMVALGRALLADPRILLCDEISLGLAPTVISDLYALLPAIRDRGIGIVLVEQDISRSLAAAARFYCLLEGRVSLSGSPGEFDRETITRYYFGS
ncbi:High-affinity branched-chain amino acid transport ATP-binding protein LivF [Methylocella tundrae]|uniref:High-affinity branched-chain amino acid transport ATP-binding protein LivF n=1 Tax=Methylocella tundrae TaxID=227605 RepID=A0A8B6M8N9_METTU|nr:ABC transporter ATP-binding protein [Methylocella tundrae]VTZ25834.1 High-affinity branched-chain amino acid transport ATP-binding protein LivF [Methylocella tundrae]VTZ51157.1 High-affinity branched-chain amino acid transport ATP-binding protein LivF [Methylocella tundrae]